MSTTTENKYISNGSTVLYSFTFPYINETDVKVSYNQLNTTAFTLANATTVELAEAPASGVSIRIYRSTPTDAISAEFFPGSAIRAQDLNSNFEQSLFVVQESQTIIDNSDAASVIGIANEALNVANQANNTANAVGDTATEALTTAQEADVTAEQALEDAAAAQTTALGAKSVADNALSPSSVISDLSNVSSTTPASGQALVWNGATWLPGNVASGGGGGGGGEGGGTTKANIYGTAKASGTFDAAGTILNSVNVSSVTFTAPNVYTVLFQTPQPSDKYTVVCSSDVGYAIFASEVSKTVNGFTLYGRNAADGSDQVVSGEFTVFDEEPAEIIVGSGTVANTNIYGTAKAWGNVNSSGVPNSAAGCTTSLVTDGTYKVTFNEPRTDVDYTVVTSTANTNYYSTSYIDFAGGTGKEFFLIYTNEANGGGQVNSAFTFTVHDNTPAEVALTTFGDVINYSGAAAWGAIDGITGTAIGSFNATTSKVSTGVYQVTFNTPMPDANYAVALAAELGICTIGPGSVTPNGFQITTFFNFTGGPADSYCTFQVAALNALPPKGGTGTDCWGSVQADGTIDASFNVASVTRTDLGKYDVVFTTPMPTANYSTVTSVTGVGSGSGSKTVGKTTTGFTVYVIDDNGLTDFPFNFTVNATNATLPLTVTQEQIESAINNPGASAWGNVAADGTLKNGLNTSSVVRDSAGSYTVSFTTPMPNDNYSVVASGGQYDILTVAPTATGFIVKIRDINDAFTDAPFNYQVFATNALPPRGGTGTDAWGSCKANGLIDASFNVASVTRAALGIYQVTFITPMPTANYAVIGSSNYITSGTYWSFSANQKTTNGFRAYICRPDVSSGAILSTDSDFSFTVNATNATLPATLTIEGALNPTGSVTMFAGATVPAGWLECNGQAAPTALATVLGQANVPDLRGEFVRGWDSGAGVDAGRALLSNQADGVNPTGLTVMAGGNESGSTGALRFMGGLGGITNRTDLIKDGESETRPRNVALMYIIKT